MGFKIGMKGCIVLPTYNERENIGKLLENLLEIFKNIKDFDMHILVVDDNSPDRTQEIVKKFLDNKKVFLITGDKKGLGTAYVRGFNYAVNELKADVIFEMDADFSHKPRDIPRFLEEIRNGNDFVIGSRYVPGGGIPENWGIHRKFLSLMGNLTTRLILGNFKIKDNIKKTGGCNPSFG